MAGALVRGIGSENIDYRLRNAEFEKASTVARYLGMRIQELSSLQRVLVVGSNLRKDHPLFAQRLRQAVPVGGELTDINAAPTDWAMPVRHSDLVPAAGWLHALSDIAAAIAVEKNVTAAQFPGLHARE